MRIREIDQSEVCRLLPCIVELSEYHNRVSVNFKGFYPSRPYEETLKAFSESMINGTSRIAAAEDQDKIIGFCKVDISGNVGKLDYLIVSEEYRSLGYGKELMDWAMNTFRDSGIRHIEVKVIDGNDAVHLYEKYGFRMRAHLLQYHEDQ